MARKAADSVQGRLGAIGCFLWMSTLPILLAACAPHVSKYRYISLTSVDGIEVRAHGKPDLESHFFSSQMPVWYSLPREAYVLHFHVIANSYHPSIRVELESRGEATLALRPQHARKRSGDVRRSCASTYPVDGERNKFDFGWACSDAAEEEMFISFDVLEENASAVEEADIPFVLEANGFYVLVDGL